MNGEYTCFPLIYLDFEYIIPACSGEDPIVFIILAGLILKSYPKTKDDTYIPFIGFCIISVILFITYIIIVYKGNKLPKANIMTKSILFVIKAQNNEMLEDIKYRLIETIQDFNYETEIICISKKKLKKYKPDDNQYVINLLKKCNCLFHVYIDYLSDNLHNPINYKMEIKAGILHPEFIESADETLKKDMNILFSSIIKQEFDNNKKINLMHESAHNLSYIYEYLIGLVCLFSGILNDADSIFSKLYILLKNEKDSTQTIKYLKDAVKLRYYQTTIYLAGKEYNDYVNNKNKINLENEFILLKKANDIIPNTYPYYLNMAVYHVLNNRDIIKAQQCIKQCKKIAKPNEDAWKFSEAFLCAYTNKHPITVYKKYKLAFKSSYNIVDIASFIEDILEVEPEKVLLHLALVLIYHECNEYSSMIFHLRHFVSFSDSKPEYCDILKIISEKIYDFYNKSLYCEIKQGDLILTA
ncbi:MAG: hypothetical protein AB9835_13150 [Eubacteriales bacterium]